MSKLNVKTANKRYPTAKNLYGLFFEDINRAADGGLYPEMLRNRSFEDSIPPERCETDEALTKIRTPRGWEDQFNHGEGLARWICDNNIPYTPIPAWYSNNAEISLDFEDTLNAKRKAALNVAFSNGGKIWNIGYAGVPYKKGELYNLYFFAKAPANPVTISAGFEDAEGRTYSATQLCVASDDYVRYELTFTADRDDFTARFFISGNDGEIKLGFISLMPAETYKSHGLRRDLVEILADMQPTFLRFPGGCIVEGFTRETAMRFSNTIGPVWERPSLELMWHYRTTNGLGYHEYLQLCEDLNLEPMYVFNCGMTCQARASELFEGEALNGMLQEAIDAVEYATAPADTKWGALRAEMGHPEPFKMTYLEIGNENNGDAYFERYKMCYDALKARFPWIRFVSNMHTERHGLPTEIADEHYYDTPEFFAENIHLYDGYDRNGPEIFIGEFAVTQTSAGQLYAALGEAMFMTGMEKNQDIVVLASYAPLLENVHYNAWYPNLIQFDNHRCCGIPTYHVWKLFGNSRGDNVIETEEEADILFRPVSGIPAILGEKNTKFKNPQLNGKPVSISHSLIGTATVVDGIYTTNSDGLSFPFPLPEAVKNRMGKAVFLTFGDDLDAVENDFEVEIFAEEGKEYGLGLFCSRLPKSVYEQDLGTGDEWTHRNVGIFRWDIIDGVSTLRQGYMFRDGESLVEPAGVELNYGAYNKLRYVTSASSIALYLNGKLIQNAAVPHFPKTAACATDTDKEIILKIVNIGGSDEPVQITLDCAVKSQYTIGLLTGDRCGMNSLDDPLNISAIEKMLIGADKNFTYTAPAYSVSVLTLKKA